MSNDTPVNPYLPPEYAEYLRRNYTPATNMSWLEAEERYLRGAEELRSLLGETLPVLHRTDTSWSETPEGQEEELIHDVNTILDEEDEDD